MNGWARLWIVACLVMAVGLAAQSYTAVAFADADSQGDLIRTLALVWVVSCLALLGLGYGIAWACRGFHR